MLQDRLRRQDKTHIDKRERRQRCKDAKCYPCLFLNRSLRDNGCTSLYPAGEADPAARSAYLVLLFSAMILKLTK